jgi:hypothetical protein
MKAIIRLIFLLTMAVSCLEQPDCINIRNNIAGVTFKSLDNGAVLAQSFDYVTANGATADVYGETSVSKISLPLDYRNDTTYYTLQIQDTVYQLVLTYTSQPQFISEKCGERFVLGSLKVVEHPFDSVRVVNATPGVDANANNIEIFR